MTEGFTDSKGKFRPTGNRKTSNLVVQAFLDGEKKKVNNTETDGENLFLFGNRIATRLPDDKVEITNAGFFTSTTQERLNAIPNVEIRQKKFKWFLNGKEWDGSDTEVDLNG